MGTCVVCHKPVVDVLTDSRANEEITDPQSASGMRIALGMCWVCRRLELQAAKGEVIQ